MSSYIETQDEPSIRRSRDHHGDAITSVKTDRYQLIFKV